MSSFLLPLAGGLLIGLAAGGFYLLAGEIAGVSGILRRGMVGPERGWRLSFLAGLIVSGLFWLALHGAAGAGSALAETAGLQGQSLPRLLIAGLLVGIGATIGNGCTSGHGVCGLARWSKRSLVAVAIFMTTAALATFLVRHGGLL